MSVPGWNDPPLFSHSALDSRGIKKSKLTKRPAQPPNSTPPPAHTPPTTITISPPHSPPPPPITTHTETSPPPTLPSQSLDKEPLVSGVDGVTDPSDGVGDYSGVIRGLESQLEKYKTSMKVREVEEVGKRLEAMRRQWEKGGISTHVMTQMSSLLQALERGRVGEAQKIQVALMVDHTSEVSLWMMGVKRLITRAEIETASHES